MERPETVSQRADRLVRQEVRCCLSGLVHLLADGFGTSAGTNRDVEALAEQAFDLAAPVLDHESAAREAGWEDSPAPP